MGWNITGTPTQVLKVAASMDDADRDKQDKVVVKDEKEKADGEAE